MPRGERDGWEDKKGVRGMGAWEVCVGLLLGENDPCRDASVKIPKQPKNIPHVMIFKKA